MSTACRGRQIVAHTSSGLQLCSLQQGTPWAAADRFYPQVLFPVEEAENEKFWGYQQHLPMSVLGEKEVAPGQSPAGWQLNRVMWPPLRASGSTSCLGSDRDAAAFPELSLCSTS